jgi:hypothetical protein
LRKWGETLHALAVSLSQPTTNTVLDITVNAPHAERFSWDARMCVYLVYSCVKKPSAQCAIACLGLCSLNPCSCFVPTL